MLRSMKDLEHYEVTATDGDVGTVTDFILDYASWSVRALVVQGHGFLTRRRALIPRVAFGRIHYSANRFRLTLTMKDVERSPTVDPDLPVWQQRDGEPAAEPRLIAAREITGYHIEGTDGPIGHVRDFVVDDETWAIQYLVIATANWWPGKSVLIAPRFATRVSPAEHKVHIAMTREAIKASPKWSATYTVDIAYAEELANHYAGVPGWIGGDRSLPLENSPAPSAREPPHEVAAADRANTRVAVHDEAQIRAADAASRNARAGRTH